MVTETTQSPCSHIWGRSPTLNTSSFPCLLGPGMRTPRRSAGGHSSEFRETHTITGNQVTRASIPGELRLQGGETQIHAWGTGGDREGRGSCFHSWFVGLVPAPWHAAPVTGCEFCAQGVRTPKPRQGTVRRSPARLPGQCSGGHTPRAKVGVTGRRGWERSAPRSTDTYHHTNIC